MNAQLFPRRGLPTGSDLRAGYLSLRAKTLALTSGLSAEDMTVQAMADASPAKWHLAHTTWFFETFVLRTYLPGYAAFDDSYAFLFNSYYESVGPRQPRAQRGHLTRPPLADVLAYREHVDRHMQTVFDCGAYTGLEDIIRLGIAHEEQHQELLLMDILYLFSRSPLKPAYDRAWPSAAAAGVAKFQPMAGGLVSIGDADAGGFAFDNERPRHKVWLEPFQIADRLVTNGEWLAFMGDGGYSRPELWLSEGWDQVQSNAWEAPLYWQRMGESWQEFGLAGMAPVDAAAAVSHISYYEANAYARWARARLPTEAEWETAARSGRLQQVDDSLWQWSASAYAPYPGFREASGAVGEYNGKFMINQMVLRGGASVTPRGHSRPTYRNFFAPDKRWQFAGLRLARDAKPPAHGKAPEADFAARDFAAHVIAGLSRPQKALSPKYFYDAEGSRLFEEICRIQEYPLTRIETALLRNVAPQLAHSIPGDAVLVEFGSGASEKTRLLLDAAPQISTYIPIDISQSALDAGAERIAAAYPRLQVIPLTADYTQDFKLPATVRGRPKTGFFPGSTIGNFTHAEAVDFLRRLAAALGTESRLILGVDLVKDPRLLVRAYDDAAGVTARFNKNLLIRINRELGGNFDVDAFEHLALWNPDLQRVEMHLVSTVDQIIQAAGHSFAFKAGERLHTENSHKFTIESITSLAATAGWSVLRHWSSVEHPFAILELESRSG